MADQHQDAVQRFKAGQASAFNEIVRAHQQGIYRLAYRLTGTVEDAKDLTQEAFIRAYRGLPGFRGDSDIGTWLYRITINLGRTWRRRQGTPPSSLDGAGELPDGPEGPEDRELRNAVKQAVFELPEKQRLAFTLHHYQGYQHQEVAKLTGRSVGSVKANYFQAVQKLRQKLESFL